MTSLTVGEEAEVQRTFKNDQGAFFIVHHVRNLRMTGPDKKERLCRLGVKR